MQQSADNHEMLKDAVDTLNTNPAPAADGASEQPVLQVPSMNGI